MQKLILAGNAVSAEILYAYLQADQRYDVVGCTVDDAYTATGTLTSVPCVGLSQVREAFAPAQCRVLMAMGYDNLNRHRQSMFERLKALGYTIESYVHPEARVHSQEPLGEGCVILSGALVEPLASVGANSVIWSNATLAHHSRVGQHCWVAAGAVVSGQAEVGRNSFVGVNASIANKVVIGEYNIVGGAAFISKCTKPQAVHLARSGEPFRCSADEYIKFFGV